MRVTFLLLLIAGIVLSALIFSSRRPSQDPSPPNAPPATPVDQVRRNQTRPRPTSRCHLACETARSLESEKVFRYLACSDVWPQYSSDGPVPAETISIHYCTKFYKQYEWYDWMQKVFISELVSDRELTYSGSVLFRLEDDSTILAKTGRALRNLGIPYLSHAHRVSPTAIDCSSRGAGKTCIYQPDFHFIEHKGYQELIQSFRKQSLPLRHRKKNVYWRGSTTGVANTCEELPRMKMCREAEKIPWLDLKITKNVLYCANKTYAVANHTKEIDWVKYRGMIDIDGNVNAWGLFWRLASGSVVFRVESQYINYYISQIIPWMHYIPLAEDLGDLKIRTSIVAMGGKSLVKLETIALNAQQLTDNITYAAEIARVRNELNEFALKTSSSAFIIHDAHTVYDAIGREKDAKIRPAYR